VVSLLEDGLDYMTDAHQRVIRWLEGAGIELREEVDFPPYRVDIYIPQFHVAVEVDGPSHGSTMDGKRDAELLEVYCLPVLRLKHDTAGRLAVDLTKKFLRRHDETSAERWEACKIKTPWL
jgi:very-short-patch-repair endonuclease